MQHLYDLQCLETCSSGQILGGILTTASQELYLYVSLNDLGLIQKSITVYRLSVTFKGSGDQNIIFLCKKIFEWYHSMVRYKRYGPLTFEWWVEKQSVLLSPLSCRGRSALRGVEWVHGLFLFPLVLGKM